MTRLWASLFSILCLESSGAIGAPGELPGTQAGGPVFSGTGSNACNTATVVPVAVGPVGSPLTVTIMGDNSAATGPDCAPPSGVHVGPVWWEAFQITQRARLTIDLCETTPVQNPSYDIIYQGCPSVPNQACVNPRRSADSGRGTPFCADANQWSTYDNLNPGTYRVPVLSDPSVLVNGLGPYVMHIHASACPGACCDGIQLTCADCIDPSSCNNPEQTFHAGMSCSELSCACPGACCHFKDETCDECSSTFSCSGPEDAFSPETSCTNAACFATIGPDLITGPVTECDHLGREGPIGSGMVGMGCETWACNKGDMRMNWIGLPDTDHPMIGINLYRLQSVEGSERFEQIGQSWIKHGYGSANADGCGLSCVPGATFNELGIGCSDAYGGPQIVDCNLGPRSILHPYTGVMPGGPSLGENGNCSNIAFEDDAFPSNDHRGHVHTPISHTVQIQEVDLDPLLHAGARYFAEGFYVSHHEYVIGNGNQNNNVSHTELTVSGPDVVGVYVYTDIGPTEVESPALDAWIGASKSMIEPTPLADGRAFVAWEVTDLGAGKWHYEYAIYNMNLDVSIGSLCVPLEPGVNISNVGFQAPLNHAPELHADNYTNDPWTPTITADAIRWDAESFITNPLANAVRFGTLYNFRFDADVPPQSVSGVAGLFKTSGLTAVAMQGPSPATLDDVNLDGIPDVCQGAIPAMLQADPGPIKTRFISFSVPQSIPEAGETALRVKLVSLHHVNPPYTGGPSVPFTSFEGQVRWVGSPTHYVPPVEGDYFYASHLQCSPHYRDWSSISMLHVTGSALVPSSIYEVEHLGASCAGVEATCTAVSVPLQIRTTRWGDVEDPYNPPSATGQPDVGDIAAMVKKFRSTLDAPKKVRVLQVGNDAFGNINNATLNNDFNFTHIAACVDAFRGKEYPHMMAACP